MCVCFNLNKLIFCKKDVNTRVLRKDLRVGCAITFSNPVMFKQNIKLYFKTLWTIEKTENVDWE